MDPDLRWTSVLGTARRQSHLVTRQQLFDAGYEKKDWKRLLRQGLLRPVARGLYETSLASDWDRRDLDALLLTAGPEAVLSHRCAARFHGLWGIEGHPLEVTVPRKRKVVANGALVFRCDLPASDVAQFGSLRVTTVARTLVDLAQVADLETLALCVEAARRRPKLLDELRERLASGGEGSGFLKALIEDVSKRTRAFDSPFEVRFWRRLLISGFPLPKPQHRVELADGRRFFIDFAWVRQKIAVELEGYEFHHATADFRRDKRRSAALAAVGWLYLPLTVERYRTDLGGFFAELRQALELPRAAKAA